MNDALAVRAAEPANIERQLRSTETQIQPAVILNRAELQFFSDMITAADLIPPDRNIPKEVQKFRVMAKIVAGAAHQFDPLSSQENLHIIQGRCVLSARGMAIKLRRTGMYDTRVEMLDGKECRLLVLEKQDGKWFVKGRVVFTLEDAKRAQLLNQNKGMYDKWGPDMLYANALKRAVRRFAPEVLDAQPIGTQLARENNPQPPQPEPPAPAELEAPTTEAAEQPDAQPETREEYVPAEYTGDDPDLIDEAVPGTIIEADEPTEYTGPETDEAEAEAEAADLGLDRETEDLRAAVEEMYGSLPKARQKDLIAGKPTIGKMTKEELDAFRVELEKEAQ